MIIVSIISKTHNLGYPNLESWNIWYVSECRFQLPSLHMLVTAIRWLASGMCHPKTACRPRARRPATWFRHGVPDGMFLQMACFWTTRRVWTYHIFSVRRMLLEGLCPHFWGPPQIIAGRGQNTGISFSEEVGEVIQCGVGFLVFVCGMTLKNAIPQMQIHEISR